MERSEIISKLKDILRMVGTVEEDKIENCKEEYALNTDLGLSSVGLLYVVIAIEEFFNIRFDDASANDFKTVKDVIDFISEKV